MTSIWHMIVCDTLHTVSWCDDLWYGEIPDIRYGEIPDIRYGEIPDIRCDESHDGLWYGIRWYVDFGPYGIMIRWETVSNAIT